MIQQLERMQGLIRELERDRAAKFGQLAGELKAAGDRAQALAATTHKLAQALASPKRRGQWGERMAEDLLRLSGLVEKINYLRRSADRGRHEAAGLHPPPAGGPAAAHGREVPARQLPAQP